MRGTLRAASVLGSTLLIMAVSCGTHVDLGGTFKDPLGGAPSDAAGGIGGSGGFGGTDGSGGGELDGGFDAPTDGTPQPDGMAPTCQPEQLTTVWVPTQAGCELVLPQPWTSFFFPFFFSGINVVYRSPMGEDRILGYVDSAEDCANVEGGWYLVDPLRPRLIVLCPETCAEMEADGGRVRAAIGCDRVPGRMR
jgi:hypothetical protein